MSSPRYKKGDWNAVCDSCGQRFKMSQLRERWDGLMVCSKDFEDRHPQDFVRAKADGQAVPVTKPESTDTFVGVCETNSAVSGYAVPTCAQAGNVILPMYAW